MGNSRTADIFEDLKARGLVQDVSDEEGLRKLKKGDAFYVGFDPTAPSLQLGNLIPLIVSVRLARAGFKPVILFGGSTGAIGDPSGKSAERQLLERKTIDANIKKQQTTAKSLFKRTGVDVAFVNNFDWTKNLSVLDFLRDTGKYFTVNYMIAKEVVKARLSGEGISYTEFSYMLLQAFDFLHLYENHNCKLQIGGSDQWGNITAGLELIRKKAHGEAYGFSIPLITDTQGKKFGKSEGGALWLDPDMTSPYRFHQFWLNVADADVMKYLRIFTFFDDAKLAALEASNKNSPEKREAQRELADAACTLVHGEAATKDAKRAAEVLFGGALDGLSPAQLEEIFQDSPSSNFPKSRLKEATFVDIVAETGLAKSKGEARRLVQSGGAYLNNERVSDVELKIVNTPVYGQGVFVLRSGKKNYHLVKVTSD